MTPPIIEAIRKGACPDIDTLVHALGHDLPALYEFARTPQDPEWHAEGDVHIHTGMVLDALYEDLERHPMSSSDRLCAVLGALLHDIAKPRTTAEVEVRGVVRIASPRHEPLGRDLLAPVMRAWNLPWREAETVMDLVGYHHEPKLLVNKNQGRGAYMRVGRAVDSELLYRVTHADMTGRTCHDRPAQIEGTELFRLFAQEYDAASWFSRWRAGFADVGPSDEARDLAFGEAVRAAEAGKVSSLEAASHFRYGREAKVPELVVLVGPSGSGKSTWVERTLAPRGFEVVSLDDIRASMRGDRGDQTVNGQVRQLGRERLKAVLRARGKAVWDATSLRVDFRSQVIELGYAYGALVTIVLFARTHASLRARNRARPHAVPESVLTRQLEGFEWPERREAHRVLVLGEQGEVLGYHGSASDTLPWGITSS